MQIEFDKMDKNNKEFDVYSYMWSDDSRIPGKICKTYYKNEQDSDNSYSFKIPGLSSKYLKTAKKLSKEEKEAIADQLILNFKIDNEEKDDFKNKLIAACSGSGGEGAKITTLHSSSLCALLFFYNVCETNPLIIDKLSGYKFVDSVFEFKNKVIGFPSNIDVVLLGHKESNENEKVILFLESKFSEYITGITKAGSKYEIGKSYFSNEYSKPIYDDESLWKKLKITIENKLSDPYLISEKDKYIEGIKQMISHYVGVRNFIEEKYYPDNDELEKVKEYRGGEIILGEILFDKFAEESLKKYQIDYESDYQVLAKKLNEIIDSDDSCKNFKVLDEILLYSDLESFVEKNEKIRNFYFGNKK